MNGSVVSKYQMESLPIVCASSAALTNASEALLLEAPIQGLPPNAL